MTHKNSNPEISDVERAVVTLDEAVNQKPDRVMTSELAISDISKSTDHIFPWERQPDETDYGWVAYRHFRDSGLTRSHAKTAAAMKRKSFNPKKNAAVMSVNQMAFRSRWAERNVAFDKEQERLYQIARGIAIRDMAARHEEMIVEAIGSLMIPIKALSLAMERDEDFIKSLSKTDAKKLISLSVRAAGMVPKLMQAERLARGMPTEIIGGVLEHQVTHRMERDQIGEVLTVLDGSGALDDRIRDLSVGEVVDAEVVEVHSVPAEGDDQ